MPWLTWNVAVVLVVGAGALTLWVFTIIVVVRVLRAGHAADEARNAALQAIAEADAQRERS